MAATQRQFPGFGAGRQQVPTKHAKAPMSALWTTDKAALVASYIHHFLFVTKHGVYVDLFAAPQDNEEDWCIRRVLEGRTRGPAISYYAACDIDPQGIRALQDLAQRSEAPFRVYRGNANDQVRQMLDDAQIRDNTPCFCLIDQRTFECNWSTVETIAKYKRAGHKIEVSTSSQNDGLTGLSPP